MSWRSATFLLLAACVGICGWLYLRDRTAPASAKSAQVDAEVDASQMLDMISSSKSCDGRCSAAVLGQSGRQMWRIRLSAPSWERCFDVDVWKFDYTSTHGLSGLRSVPCNAIRRQ